MLQKVKKLGSRVAGVVFNIMRFAVHDGPGIRTIVFLKGCPLHCWWCQNPEGQSSKSELVLRLERCVNCGACRAVCATGGLGDRNICVSCGKCAVVCPAEAREIAGQLMTIDEVMTEIEKDKIFYDQSGGGVTFSGGEPFAQADFLENMLEHCLQHDIHTVIETTGHAAPEVFQRVAQKADSILYDFKIMDNSRHRKFTGVGNDLILENLRWLAANHKHVELRFPVIPGINDDEENVLALAKLAKSLHIRAVHLLPYHQSGLAKYRRLNRRYRLLKLAPPSEQQMADIRAKLKKAGVKVIDGD